MYCKSMAFVVLLGAIGARFTHGAPPVGLVRRDCTSNAWSGTCNDTDSLNAAGDQAVACPCENISDGFGNVSVWYPTC